MDARLLRQAHGRLAAQHGRLEHLPPALLRAAAAVLPVRLRPAERDRLARASSRSAPSAAWTGSRSCTARGSTRCRSAAARAAARCGASPRSATSGSTRASSRSRRSAGGTPSGSRAGTRPARRAGSRAPTCPTTRTGRVVPGRLGLEMREQIRLWFYSKLFMSVALDGRAPYRAVLAYEKMFDEQGREMHGSWGNMIELEDAFERMGADVMRWLYCAQPPSQKLHFGYGPAHEIKRRLLTLWNSVQVLRHVREHRRVPRLVRRARRGGRPGGAAAARPLAGRAHGAARRGRRRRRTSATARVGVVRAFEAFVDDLSNWYIRRSRRRFWDGDEAALRTLWFALVQALRVIAPVMPFLAEHLWQTLVARCRGRRARLRLPRRLAGAGRAGRGAARGDGRGAARRRARPAGAGSVGAEAASAAAPARRPGRAARRGAPRRDRRRAARQGGRVRRRSKPTSCA